MILLVFFMLVVAAVIYFLWRINAVYEFRAKIFRKDYLLYLNLPTYRHMVYGRPFTPLKLEYWIEEPEPK